MRVACSSWILFGGVIAACSTSPSNPPVDAGGSDDQKTQKDVIQPDQFVASCTDTKACDPSTQATNSSCLVSVDATLLDLMAKPVATESVFICGTNLCTSPLAANAMGKVHGDVCLWFIKAAFKYLGGPNYVSFASTIPANMTAVSLPSVVLTPLPVAGADFPANGGDIVSNGVTLTAPAAAGVKFDSSESSDANWHKFRVAQVDLKNAPPFFDNTTLKLEVLWGLAHHAVRGLEGPEHAEMGRKRRRRVLPQRREQRRREPARALWRLGPHRHRSRERRRIDRQHRRRHGQRRPDDWDRRHTSEVGALYHANPILKDGASGRSASTERQLFDRSPKVAQVRASPRRAFCESQSRLPMPHPSGWART